MIQESLEQSSNVTFAAAGSAVVLGFAFETWMGVFGVLIGLCGLGVNWWYKNETLKELRKG